MTQPQQPQTPNQNRNVDLTDALVNMQRDQQLPVPDAAQTSTTRALVVQERLPVITNYCTAFDGSTGNVAIAASPYLNTAAFSVETWLNADTLRTQGVIGKVTNNRWRIFMQDSGGKLEFDGLAGELGNITTIAGLVAGTRYHVCGTFDGTTMRLYLNGVLQSSAVAALVNTNNVNIQIAISETNRFDGKIDEVALYIGALSATRILAHYNAGITPTGKYPLAVLQDNPVGYFRLDDQTGTNARDISGNGLTGTYAGSYTLAQPGLIDYAPPFWPDSYVQDAATSPATMGFNIGGHNRVSYRHEKLTFVEQFSESHHTKQTWTWMNDAGNVGDAKWDLFSWGA